MVGRYLLMGYASCVMPSFASRWEKKINSDLGKGKTVSKMTVRLFKMRWKSYACAYEDGLSHDFVSSR